MSHDHVASADLAAIRLDHMRLAAPHAAGTCQLEDVAAIAGQRRGESEQVLARVELRLVLEPDSAGNLVRKRRLAHE